LCIPILAPQLKEALDKYLSENKVVLFMKGNRMFPQCGFSNTCVQILNSLEVPYETVNILEDENLRQGMKVYSSWPTFPQLYIDGEFFGGCDITLGKQLGILTFILRIFNMHKRKSRGTKTRFIATMYYIFCRSVCT
jgi:monothiol glutaredoxin